MIRNTQEVLDMISALTEEQRTRLQTLLALHGQKEALADYIASLPAEDAQPFTDIMKALK